MLNYYCEEKLEAGIDEVARGCLAGPVFAAAVIWPQELELEEEYSKPDIKDSKKLSKRKREDLRYYIEENAIDFSVSYETNRVIDKVNILNATFSAMHKAVRGLNVEPDFLLVDGQTFKPYYSPSGELLEHKCIISGDDTYISIACASILAKVYHDNYIEDLLKSEPELDRYGWSTNMCYGTNIHTEAIKQYGITKYHRKTFGICRNYKVSKN